MKRFIIKSFSLNFLTLLVFILLMLATPSIAKANVGDGPWSASGTKLVDVHGNTVKIAGVNFGYMYSSTNAGANIDGKMRQMKKYGFNTIRFLFATEAFDETNVDTSLANLDEFVRTAGQTGLKIILDRHRLRFADQTESELWYSTLYPEKRWIKDWKMLAKRYKGNPTIIGADLHNEPHGAACWGCSNPKYNWPAAAARAGKAILNTNPDWLIIVEGVEHTGDNKRHWWGGNLSLAGEKPVDLPKNKLVYSAHEYGKNIIGEGFYNTQSEWNNDWGYLHKNGIAPVLIGEFGTLYRGTREQKWFDDLINYLGSETEGISWTYFNWNPCCGLLDENWDINPIVYNKLKKIQDPLNLSPILGNIPDANGDGFVDFQDFLILRENFGKSLTQISDGDFNSDGKIDGFDYSVWFDHCQQNCKIQ